MKRTFTMLAASLVMMCSMATTSFAAYFSDVTEQTTWAATHINQVADLGIVAGYTDGTYRPTNEVTYLETMQMIYRLMLFTNEAEEIGDTEFVKYYMDIDAAGIPLWGQRAVAFGLQNKIITLDDVDDFMQDGVHQAATREDVGKMIGAAFAITNDLDRTAAEVDKFTDWWDFAEDTKMYVDLAMRLGIINGYTDGSFKPKDTINRAEMAVLLEKSHTVFTYGADLTGTIIGVVNNGTSFHIEIDYDIGGTETFYARSDLISVYAGENGSLTSLLYLGEGDRVKIIKYSNTLSEIHILSDIDSQSRFDVTGYIMKMTGGAMTVENENTGNYEVFTVSGGTTIFLDGEYVTSSALESAINDKDNYYKHAYVSMDIDTVYGTETTSDKKVVLTQDVTVQSVQVVFQDEYTQKGRITNLTDTYVTFTSLNNETTTQYQITDTTDTYIDGKVASMSSMQSLVESGTTYITATVAQNNVLLRMELSNSIDTYGTEETNTVYTLDGISIKQIDLTHSGQQYVCYFGTDNPTSNITFYWWLPDASDSSKGSWRDYDIDAIRSIRNSVLDDDEDAKIYAKLAFNAGGKLIQVQISETRSAWTYDTAYGNSEIRKGTISSYDGTYIRFEGVDTDYELLSAYNTNLGSDNSSYVTGEDPNDSTKTVRSPLKISSAVTSSLLVFTRMLEGDGLEIYAEIIADANKKVQKIDARLVEAKGYLRYFDLDDDVMQLELINTGEILNLVLNHRVDVIADVNDEEELESPKYHGSLVYLTFNTSGEVSELRMVDDANLQRDDYIAGTASGNGNGLYLESDPDQIYGWGNRSSTYVKNNSINSTSTYTVQYMLDDPDVGVYIEAQLTENKSIDSITVTAKSAVGVLDYYNEDANTIRIITESGNTFTFYIDRNPSININNLDPENINTMGKGVEISLTFNAGIVTKVNNT